MSFITTLPHLRSQMVDPPSFILETESGQMSQVSELHDLIKTNKSRKEVYKEAQYVSNRISLLRQQEMRTWKKTQENEKKAMDIYEQRVQPQAVLQEKKARLQEQHQQHLDELKQKRQIDEQKSHQRHRKQLRAKNKKQTLMNDYFNNQQTRLQHNRSQEQSRNREQFQHAKIKQDQQRAYLQAYSQMKVEQVRQQQQTQKTLDRQQVKFIQHEVDSMHKIEDELVQRLQLSQQLKVFSQQKLKEVKTFKPHNFQQRYQKFDTQKENNRSGMAQSSNILTEY